MPPKRRSASKKRSYSRKRVVAPREQKSKTPASRRRSRSIGSRLLGGVGRVAEAVAPALVSSVLGPGAGMAGVALSPAIMRGATSLLKFVTGHGDYKITSNSLIPTGSSSDSLPSFKNVNRGVRVSHREFLFDVISSATPGQFQVQKVPLQPGTALPWLSTMAGSFQEYQINGMIFEYKSFMSDSVIGTATNPSIGQVVMSTQYNVLQPDFQNTRQMQQNEFVSSVKPSMDVMHPIECARSESPVVVLNTRTGTPASLPAGSDLRLYDFANMYLATEGMQGASQNCGQLWCTYDITLLKPQLGPSADVADHFRASSATDNGLDATHFFGNPIAQAVPTSDLGAVITDNTITIPESYTGKIMVFWMCAGSNATGLQGPTFTPDGVGITPFNCLYDYAGVLVNANSPTTDSASGQPQSVAFFNVLNGGVITLSAGAFPANPVGTDLIVLSIPAQLAS